MNMLSNSYIHFSKYYPKSNDNDYRDIYEVAYTIDKQIVSHSQLRNKFLSRIPKKNGKHRYYITTESSKIICNGCGFSNACFNPMDCEGFIEGEFKYSSVYVGKNLECAIFRLCNL